MTMTMAVAVAMATPRQGHGIKGFSGVAKRKHHDLAVGPGSRANHVVRKSGAHRRQGS
jgi:hypothetical protein